MSPILRPGRLPGASLPALLPVLCSRRSSPGAHCHILASEPAATQPAPVYVDADVLPASAPGNSRGGGGRGHCPAAKSVSPKHIDASSPAAYTGPLLPALSRPPTTC